MNPIKKLFFLLFFTVAFAPLNSRASHIIGGEITWTCLPTGQFVFKMDIYRECTGPGFYFTTHTISYQGGSITMMPDSNRWLRYGAGNISPKGPSGCQKQCDQPGAEIGAIQFLPYISDPVTLNGTPPPGGWLFTWTQCCRRSDVVNLSSPAAANFTLRAIMYPFNGESTASCYDSSPFFAEPPTVTVCKGYDFIYNPTVVDNDLDSLVYSWDHPWDTKNNPVNYAAGYSYLNPMPDSNINPLNKAAVLNKQTGEIRFATYSGQSGVTYATTLRIDAYRSGIKIASIFRDLSFSLVDCPVLPGIGKENNPSNSIINGLPSTGYTDTVFAGDKIAINFQSVDRDTVYTDPNNPNTATKQWHYISPSGFAFSNDFTDPNNCRTANFAPCATLTPPPTRNPIDDQLELVGQDTISTLLEWQTTCAHLQIPDSNGWLGGRRYNFVMKSYDDHCDVPAVVFPNISILLMQYIPEITRTANILSVDSADSYQWFLDGNPIPNSDTNQITIDTTSGKYSVEVVYKGCPSRRAVYKKYNVGLGEIPLDKYFELYPNPFKHVLVLENKLNPEIDVHYQLLDLNGRKLQTQISKRDAKVYITGGNSLARGLYLLKISTDKSSLLKKVVKY